jgi:hypothetical protein
VDVLPGAAGAALRHVRRPLPPVQAHRIAPQCHRPTVDERHQGVRLRTAGLVRSDRHRLARCWTIRETDSGFGDGAKWHGELPSDDSRTWGSEVWGVTFDRNRMCAVKWAVSVIASPRARLPGIRQFDGFDLSCPVSSRT